MEQLTMSGEQIGTAHKQGSEPILGQSEFTQYSAKNKS